MAVKVIKWKGVRGYLCGRKTRGKKNLKGLTAAMPWKREGLLRSNSRSRGLSAAMGTIGLLVPGLGVFTGRGGAGVKRESNLLLEVPSSV